MRSASRCFFTVLLAAAAGVPVAAQTPAPDFDGTWNTVTSKGKKIVVTLQSVRRAEVSGTYAVNALTGTAQARPPASPFVNAAFAPAAALPMQSLSTIRGRVAGNVLRFRWQEDGGHGAGKFTLSADGESFQGTFSMTDLPDDTSGGTWNGTRAPNFQGVWRTMAGSQLQFPELLLQQSGMQVSGRLFGNRPDMGVIKEGVVDGNTLRFKVYRPRPFVPNMRPLPDDYVGTGELQMDGGSKSFKGTILGAATSGNLITR
jgi:hypothetical protein